MIEGYGELVRRIIRTKLFWLRFDVEIYFARLPTAWWCLKKFLKTRDLGYLHDCLWTFIP